MHEARPLACVQRPGPGMWIQVRLSFSLYHMYLLVFTEEKKKKKVLLLWEVSFSGALGCGDVQQSDRCQKICNVRKMKRRYINSSRHRIVVVAAAVAAIVLVVDRRPP